MWKPVINGEMFLIYSFEFEKVPGKTSYIFQLRFLHSLFTELCLIDSWTLTTPVFVISEIMVWCLTFWSQMAYDCFPLMRLKVLRPQRIFNSNDIYHLSNSSQEMDPPWTFFFILCSFLFGTNWYFPKSWKFPGDVSGSGWENLDQKKDSKSVSNKLGNKFPWRRKFVYQRPHHYNLRFQAARFVIYSNWERWESQSIVRGHFSTQ